jgi:hypothetical protein
MHNLIGLHQHFVSAAKLICHGRLLHEIVRVPVPQKHAPNADDPVASTRAGNKRTHYLFVILDASGGMKHREA